MAGAIFTVSAGRTLSTANWLLVGPVGLGQKELPREGELSPPKTPLGESRLRGAIEGLGVGRGVVYVLNGAGWIWRRAQARPSGEIGRSVNRKALAGLASEVQPKLPVAERQDTREFR